MIAVALLPLLAAILIPARSEWAWVVTSIMFGTAALAAAFSFRNQVAAVSPLWSMGWLALPLSGVLQLMAKLTTDPAATSRQTVVWLSVALLTLALQGVLEEERRRERLFTVLVWLGLGLGALSLVGSLLFRLGVLVQPSLLPAFQNRNQWAAFALLLLPIAMHRARAKDRTLSALAATILLLSILAGGSRMGLLLTAAMGVFLVQGMRWQWTAAAATAIASAIPFSFDGRGDGNRLDLWASCLDLIQARPWLGHGLGSFELVYPPFARFDNGLIVDHAHNQWLEWMVETGVVVVLPLGILAWVATRKAMDYRWALGAPALFLFGFSDYPLANPAIQSTLALVLGGLAASGLRDPDRSQVRSLLPGRRVLQLEPLASLRSHRRGDSPPLETIPQST